jgi:hypothetical protein
MIVKNYVDSLREIYPVSEIVSGGARGVDALGKRYAEENGLLYTEFPAEWDKYGKSAGYKRNVLIVDHAEYLLAFWDQKSPGTKHSIDLAKKKGIPIGVIHV